MVNHMTSPKLTISLLSSGRPETLWKCLDSLKKIREQIPSELIIVDTGCDETTRKRMENYTEHIVYFKWCKDFAKARNAGLKEASGEWFYFLDDDEAVLDAEELIRFFRSGEYREYDTASYIIRNYFNPEYTMYEDTRVTRMKKITPEIRFEGKIHERLMPPAIRSKQLNDVVEHFGYVFTTEEERKKHSERNIPPLLEMLEEEPEEPHWLYQLVQEYHSVGEYEKELELCERGIKLCVGRQDQFYGFFLFRKANALMMEGKGGEALEFARHLLGDQSAQESVEGAGTGTGNLLQIPKARLLALAANLAYKTDPEYCEHACLQYLQIYEGLKDHPDTWDREGANLIFDAFHEKSLCVVYTALIGCGLRRGYDGYLLQYYRDLPLNQCPIPNLQAYAAAFFDAMHRLDYKAEYEDVLRELSGYIAQDDPYLMECKDHLRNSAISGIQQMAEKLRQQVELLRKNGNDVVADQIEAQLQNLGF